MSSRQPRIFCREITAADIDGVVDFLAGGFTGRGRAHWVRALARLAQHRSPAGFPKYGFLLCSDERPVGVILVIYAATLVGGVTKIRCNLSSWYVDPAYRAYAAMLAARALQHKDVTYFNVTPAPGTLPMLEAQGYRRYCTGRFIAVPALAPRVLGAKVAVAPADLHAGEDLPQVEVDILLDHARFGCISVVCSMADRRYPFVFVARRKSGWLPYARLVYCRDLAEFVEFAGPLGRFLARRGLPLVALDANGSVPGLIGSYGDDMPKYFKGPDRPRLGNIAYSERVIFGI